MFGFVIDMDGVIVRGHKPVPGASQFVKKLLKSKRRFLLLTNNPDYSPVEQSARLKEMNIPVPPQFIYTAAEATARFLKSQNSLPRVYSIGTLALDDALISHGAQITENNPEYVVVGSGHSYDFGRLEKAINFVINGSKLIGTNPDPLGPREIGFSPGCGALIAPIEKATGIKPYFIGKPNPLMMRTALRKMGTHSSKAYMVGDRMDTDIIAGIESGMKTILVLSGVTKTRDINSFPYRPDFIFPDVNHIPLSKLP